jgi:hypothetical protein
VRKGVWLGHNSQKSTLLNVLLPQSLCRKKEGIPNPVWKIIGGSLKRNQLIRGSRVFLTDRKKQ